MKKKHKPKKHILKNKETVDNTKFSKNLPVYIIILIFTFLLYGNTLTHDYVLDDAIVVTQNDFTLDGIDGIPAIMKTELFHGFFGRQKDLVAGGRYRPLSLVTFAIECELILGSPFKNLDEEKIKRKLDGTKKKLITTSRTLQKDLFGTLNIEDDETRLKYQKVYLEKSKKLNSREIKAISQNLEEMRTSRNTLVFVSHFVNVLLYAITGAVLYTILLLFFVGKQNTTLDKKNWFKSIPFIATILFIAHPIHTEVIANIKGRDEILSLLLSLLTLLISFRYLETKKFKFLIYSFIVFLLALLSKENTITFFAIIPFAIHFFTETPLKKNLITIAPMLIATIIFFSIRQSILSSATNMEVTELMNNPFMGSTFAEKYATIIYTLGLYLKLLIFPHPLTFDYYPFHLPFFDYIENGQKLLNWTDFRAIVSLLVYAALGYLAISGLKTKKVVSFGIWYYIATLSIASNILFPIGVFMNERFVYSSSIGFIIIVAYLLVEKLPNIIKSPNVYKTSMIAFLSLVFLLYSIKSITRNRAWKDDLTLFTTDVEVSYRSAKSTTSAGGKLTEEAQKYPITKDMNPKLKVEYEQTRKEMLEPAIKYLNQAIDIHPTYVNAILLLGNAHYELNKNYDSALFYYEEILRINPNYDLAYKNAINILSKNDDTDYCIGAYKSILEINSKLFEINYNLGSLYGKKKNDIPNSIKYLEAAVKIRPNSSEANKDLGVAYGFAGNFQKSIEYLEKAIRVDPNDAQLYINLGINYRQIGQTEKAQECFTKAGQLDPKYRQ